MTDKPVVRASTLARLSVCPASYAESIDKVNPSSADAQLGSAFHHAMHLATQRGRAEVDIDAVASAFGVPAKDLSALWHGFTFDPSRGASERSIAFGDEHVQITGRLDWIDVQPEGVVSLVDWKTGHRIEEDPEPWNDPQTQAYAVGLLLQEPDVLEVRTQKAYVRRGDNGWSATYSITRENMDEIAERLLGIAREAVGQIDKTEDRRRYTLSYHCDYCPGRVSCPAVAREVEAALSAVRSVAVLKKDGTPSKRSETRVSLALTVETIPKWHQVVRLLGRAKDAIHEQIREAVRSLGPIQVEPGKFLAVKIGHRRVPLTETLIRQAASDAGIQPEQIEAMMETLISRDRREEERLDIYTEETLAKADE